MVNLRSEDNAADAPSRRSHPSEADICQTAHKLATDQLQARQAGRRENAYDPSHAPSLQERAARLDPTYETEKVDSSRPKKWKKVEDLCQIHSEVEVFQNPLHPDEDGEEDDTEEASYLPAF